MQPLSLGELFRMYYQMYQGLRKLGLSQDDALEKVAEVMLGGFGAE